MSRQEDIKLTCPNCDTSDPKDFVVMTEDVAKCLVCGEILDMIDAPPPPKQHRTKPSKFDEDWEDGKPNTR